MGRVACERHGSHAGLLCCNHVYEAVIAGSHLESYENYRYDIDGTESNLLDHMICSACATRHQLSPNELIPDEVWSDEARFPKVFPICASCFVEWRSRAPA
jgi:hypothetical protein